MANSRIARFFMEVAPPQYVNVMRHRTSKMLDTITEDEKEISSNDSVISPPKSSAASSAASASVTSAKSRDRVDMVLSATLTRDKCIGLHRPPAVTRSLARPKMDDFHRIQPSDQGLPRRAPTVGVYQGLDSSSPDLLDTSFLSDHRIRLLFFLPSHDLSLTSCCDGC
ncbi:hypothetical protein VNO80_10517 [Phaseolus coccineus]|uniref:Uncharacterized protein n=1 Tax=Phaseolus coccineus TaxID=3886 RepID=A0AAN9N8T9_PHACN